MKVSKMKTLKEKTKMNKNMKLFCKKKLKKPNTYTLQTEYEAVQTAMSKNIDRSFKTFNG